jgi:hypothetical protein
MIEQVMPHLAERIARASRATRPLAVFAAAAQLSAFLHLSFNLNGDKLRQVLRMVRITVLYCFRISLGAFEPIVCSRWYRRFSTIGSS